MRVFFFNEGNLGAYIMGQGQLDAALDVGLADMAGVAARFDGLAPMGRWASAVASHDVPVLTRLGLDMTTLRWHLVQSVRARRALRRALREWPADVVTVHSQSVSLLMGGTMRAVPVALSVDTTVRDWWAMPAWRPPQRYASATIAPSVVLERRAFRSAAVVLAWTEWARKSVERTAPEANVIEHHPGIDLVRYRPAPRRERPRPRILFVGGRFRAKGGEDLLCALGDLLGNDLDLDLVTPAAIEERAGVGVHRLGPTDPRLLDLQQQADIMCLPTYGDANPWAVLEAMACGTPVISTRVGGIPDMLDDGRSGVLLPHGEPRLLRDALRSLLADDERRRQLAVRARERCEERYDARKQFPRLIDHLCNAISRRPRSDV